ncbi:hypothetical protein HDU96_004373, partial [Phlyctochytrium bullatum]
VPSTAPRALPPTEVTGIAPGDTQLSLLEEFGVVKPAAAATAPRPVPGTASPAPSATSSLGIGRLTLQSPDTAAPAVKSKSTPATHVAGAEKLASAPSAPDPTTSSGKGGDAAKRKRDPPPPPPPPAPPASDAAAPPSKTAILQSKLGRSDESAVKDPVAVVAPPAEAPPAPSKTSEKSPAKSSKKSSSSSSRRSSRASSSGGRGRKSKSRRSDEVVSVDSRSPSRSPSVRRTDSSRRRRVAEDEGN